MNGRTFDLYSRVVLWTHLFLFGASLLVSLEVQIARLGPQDPYFDPAMLFVVPIAIEFYVFIASALAGIVLHTDRRRLSNQFLALGVASLLLCFGTVIWVVASDG